MKKRIKNFGFVFIIEGGIHKGKFVYCYKDKEGKNQHSKPFKSLINCSQEFALKFIEHMDREIKNFIKDN